MTLLRISSWFNWALHQINILSTYRFQIKKRIEMDIWQRTDFHQPSSNLTHRIVGYHIDSLFPKRAEETEELKQTNQIQNSHSSFLQTYVLFIGSSKRMWSCLLFVYFGFVTRRVSEHTHRNKWMKSCEIHYNSQTASEGGVSSDLWVELDVHWL